MFPVLTFLRAKLLLGIRFGGIKALLFFVALLWYTTSAFLYFEMEAKPELGWLDALWWAIVTMATVGYGDLFPTTNLGRYLAGVPAILLGIGFLGYILTSVATRLVEARSRRIQGMTTPDIQDHVLIFNYTRSDEIIDLVHELRSDPATKRKAICLVDEALAEIPGSLAELDIHFVKGSPTDEATLTRAGLARASHAILLAKDRMDYHSDDQNLVTVMMIEKLSPNVFTIVEMIDKRKQSQFSLAGANQIVCLGELSMGLLTREISDPGVTAVVRELVSNASGSELYVVKITARAQASFRDLVMKGIDHNVSVIGIMRDGSPQLNCPPRLELVSTDKAIVVGTDRIGEIAV